jgi:hypothetical protein
MGLLVLVNVTVLLFPLIISLRFSAVKYYFLDFYVGPEHFIDLLEQRPQLVITYGVYV